MLDTLDVLIGFTVVMLVVSMAVTMITQAFSTVLMNLRGMCLHDGIAKLLALMDRGLTVPEAKRLSDHILRNPLVGQAPILWGRPGLTSVIHREELVKLILDFAVPGDAEKANDEESADEEGLRNKVRRSLAANGIPDPEAVLQSVRTAVVELEKSHPEMSHNARLNIALLNFASSDYLSKLNTWFDQSIDRVSDLFTRRIRVVTVIIAVILAFVIQLDAVGLMNRLSVDDELRNRLVETALDKSPEWKRTIDASQTPPTDTSETGNESAVAANETAPADEADGNESAGDVEANVSEPAPKASGDGADASGNGPKTASEQLDQARRTLDELGVVALPTSFTQWCQAWWHEPAEGTCGPAEGTGLRWPFFIGILLSAALLSLGAPWWYSLLANLLKLRSVISRKDEVERVERQTTQTPATPVAASPGAAASGLPPNLTGGEAGDLTATG